MKRERPIRQIRILYLYSFLLFLQPLRHFVPPPLYFALQKHPAMLRDTAREEGATKDFLSLSKKVLVTLICVICSFFSTARRTNQEAPPLLSGFWVRRYGRRRGLRNSLRSDSPRPFSSVFLATSPPDKGGIGGSCLYSNPLALWVLPLYSLTETQGERVRVPFCSLQCDTPHTGYGRGRVGVMLNFRLALFPI